MSEVEQYLGKLDAGRKKDADKLRFDLILPEFEEAMAHVLTHGAKEYGANNWQKVAGAKARYTGALQRHLNQYRKGYMYDLDSDCNNLAQIAVNAMFLYWFERQPQLMCMAEDQLLVARAALTENIDGGLRNADKILSGIDNRVLAAATGTKQDCATSREADTACESGFTTSRYK